MEIKELMTVMVIEKDGRPGVAVSGKNIKLVDLPKYTVMMIDAMRNAFVSMSVHGGLVEGQAKDLFDGFLKQLTAAGHVDLGAEVSGRVKSRL